MSLVIKNQEIAIIQRLININHVRSDSGRSALYHALCSRDNHGHDGQLLSAVPQSQCHSPRRHATPPSAPLDCSLICQPSAGPHVVYAALLSHLTRGCQVDDLVGGLLDSMTVIPLEIAVLFVMLQDRQRPLWPIAVMLAPIIVVSAFNAATLSYDFMLGLYVYSLLMCMGLIIYMVRALRQYGRWLRENYADLEHKEVWQSFVVLAIIMLAFVIYALTSEGVVYQYAMRLIIIVLICYLLWRVETLSDLSISQQQSQMAAELATVESEDADHDELPQAIRDKIRTSLQQHCIDTQLYLQHDLTISQLAQAIGTNRTYLSQYFSSQGLTYNAYINDLRINHFVSLYRENVAAQRSFTVYQLAKESGYSSYSTFCGIIKRKTGLSVTAWMKDIAPDLELREGLREP